MIKVVFRADIKALDEEYFDTAERLRKLAMERYGCLSFEGSSEGGVEVAVSCWPSREHVQRWRDAPEHKAAQHKGKTRWYNSWHLEILDMEDSLDPEPESSHGNLQNAGRA